MKTIEIASATGSLNKYVRELNQEALVLTDKGQPVAALMPIDDADLEGLSLGENPKFLALIEKARNQRRAGAGLSAEEVRQELGL